MGDDLINGFTGFGRKNPNFVSAQDAIRRSEREARDGSRDNRSAYRQQKKQSTLFVPASSRSQNERASSLSSDILKYAADRDPESEGPLRFDPEKLARISEVDRRWAWTEIDLNALRSNLSSLKRRITPGTRFLAVVKADGYGMGAVPCAKTALNSGADYLGVATVDEGIKLREAMINAPILMLSQPPETAIPLLLGYKIMPTIYTADFAIHYAEAADAFGLKAPYHLKVNTGMNRIGVRYDEVVEFLRQVSFHRALELVGTFTHYATADSFETLDFQIQTNHFLEALKDMRQAGFDPGIVHAANSSAAIRYPDVHFDMVRIGLAMYGYYPSLPTQSLVELKPMMSIKARITDCKTVPMSEGVSYGLNYRSPGSVKICTVPIGYADGLRFNLSQRINFIYEGQRCRQVGNICMDQSMFEVDMRSYAMKKRLDPQVGDQVTIVGSEGDAVASVEQMADLLDTNIYELIIGFSHRLPRIYL